MTVQWVNKLGQDIYCRTARRWARITRSKNGWYVAKGFKGEINASYGAIAKTKRFALTVAEDWVTDD